jgi:hypothetical protein
VGGQPLAGKRRWEPALVDAVLAQDLGDGPAVVEQAPGVEVDGDDGGGADRRDDRGRLGVDPRGGEQPPHALRVVDRGLGGSRTTARGERGVRSRRTRSDLWLSHRTVSVVAETLPPGGAREPASFVRTASRAVEQRGRMAPPGRPAGHAPASARP